LTSKLCGGKTRDNERRRAGDVSAPAASGESF